ncbi:SusE domain-containing protein [Rufibacter radiotolerans]|uniref:SusE domain-containing protein n=1 Tax=Rufibacter radiotolerans TaxID=1379910 RepID=UPI000664635A|nr:SusE domain-containing protein [Rufibacter radiotolerans]
MKTTLIKHFSLLGLVLFLFSSCEKDEDRIVANTNGTGAAFTSSSNNLMLSKANQDKEAVKFTWTEANFGFDAALTNTIQFAKAGTNFANAKEVVIPGGITSRSYSVLDFNALLLSMSLPTGANSTIETRVKSEITGSTAFAPVYSNVVSMTVNPYALISYVYVPGAYQGWNPATADSLISPTSNGIYTGIINFTPGNLMFKITPAKNWNTAYGDAGGGNVSTSGGDIAAPSAGMYRLTLDLNANTLAMAKYSWGVIGSATAGGWNSDTDLTYNNGTQTWSLNTNLVAGEIKFRLNDDWGTNYGGSGGNLVQGGDNIAISSAGNYRITFSLATNTYTVTKL